MSTPRSPQAASSDQPFAGDPIDLRNYWRIIVRRRLLIAGVFVAALALGGIYTLRQPKTYDATCVLVIDISGPRVLDAQQVQDVVDSGAGSYWYSREYYETQYKILTSRVVASRVVDKLRLGEDLHFLGLDKVADAELRRKRAALLDPAALAQARLRVEPVKDSRIVKLRVEDTDPSEAAALANAFADAYIAETLSVKTSTTHSATDWLEQQLGDLEVKLQKSGEALFDFKKQKDIVSTTFEDKQSMTSQRLAQLNDALTRARTQKAQLQARNDAIEELRKATIGDQAWPDGLPAMANNTLIQQLKLRYMDAKNECSDLAERYLDKHPKLAACQEKLSLARRNLQKEVETVLTAAQGEYRESLQTERNLLALYNDAKTDSFKVNEVEPEYQQLKRAFDTNQRLYDLVLKRLKEAGLSGLMQMSNVRVLDRARVSSIPVSPSIRTNVIVALLLGLFGGLALAFVVELLDTSITTQQQVEERLGLTFLGIIPNIEAGKDGRPSDLIVHDQPKSAVAECCRAIRTNVLFMSPDRPLQTILITSSGPQDGKTTAAISLAITMAESGNRTLLVDADMRRPRVHRAFDLPNGKGLSSLILGEGTLEEVVKSSQIPNLSILTCGPIPPNPAELLHTVAFATLLKQIVGRFDRIIIDSPPIGAVADAVVMSTLADGTVMVLKAARTSRELAKRTIRALKGVNARIFGAVLNDLNLDDRNHADYYYYRAYGYYYGDKDKKASPAAS
jgi:capsular exopolysaccharide synthesis family protein